MKTRWICGVGAALAISAAATLFGQAPAGGGQAPPPEGRGGRGAGGRGGGGGGVSLRPKALDTTPDIPYEVVPNFFKLPPNVYMGEGIGVSTNSKGHIFVNTCAQQTR